MKFEPLHSLVLVEKLETQKASSGIILSPTREGRFWRVKVIAIGPNINEDGLEPLINIGDTYYCNPLPEIDDIQAFDNPNYRLVNFGNILGRITDE